ncbi:hypothetical protein DER44DRAFT_731503 [Fusarium oxysporum]|nr:hypothetical protein DER44DRAFT_731503 [Fusarium oxysporum]
MEVTFGAVGDFISIGVLIKDFIELLDDSRGSAWEYNSLRQQLIFLRLNLDLAKRSYDEYYNAPQFQDIRNTLESVVDEAERRLEDIAVKVQKYTTTLSQGSTERRIKKVAKKVQWSLEKKETEKFLLDLNRYTSIIQSLQFDAFARLMERNFNSSQKDQSDTKELVSKLQKDFGDRFTCLEEELRAVKTTSANTQQYLLNISMVVTRRLDIVTQTVNSLGLAVLRGVSGMSYLGTSVLSLLSTMHNNIIGRLERPPHMGPYFTFEDYLGVDSIILLNFVDSWNAFEGSLHGKFKGRKGGRRVAQNRFLLQDHQTGDEIDRDAHWSLAITPGSRINMSLICEVKEDENEAQSLKCPFPSCGAMCEGVIGTVIQCPSCQQLFRKLPGMSDDEELPVAPNAPDSGINDPNLKPGSNPSKLGQSRKRKGAPLDKRRALRAKRKPTDARNAGSDSDDADLTGIRRHNTLLSKNKKRVAAQITSPRVTALKHHRGPSSHNPGARIKDTRVPQRPSTSRDTGSEEKKKSVKKDVRDVRKATEADAKRHKIPTGYSLKHWDPDEEPILLLGSVFDAFSFGKWVYDWSVYAHGPSTPISDMAGEFWLLLIQLAGKVKRAEETVGRVRLVDSKDLVEEFIEAGERLWAKLVSLLKKCEAPMLEAYKLKERKRKNTKNAGVVFIDTLFGQDKELKRTERWMQNMRIYNLRFDANCEDMIRNPSKY